MSEETTEYVVSGENAAGMTTLGKPIRCPECRQVIGHVLRRGGVRTFRLEVGGFAVETAFDAEIWCCCGGLLVWHAGQEALDELLERLNRRDTENAEIAE